MTMRAFAIDEFGATGSIHDLPDPEPGEGQVRVRIEAASVNPADLGMLSGAYKDFMEHHFPLVPGLDLAGVVDAVGAGVAGLTVGDPVFGVHGKRSVGQGTLAELAIAAEGTLAKRPAAIDAPFGTALSLAGVSALEMLDAAAPGDGDVVLVVGATGGIGSIALQLLAAAGATSIAVTRTVNHGYARDLGATETIDYETEDVVATVRSAHPDGVTALFHLAGDKDEIAPLIELVRPSGHVVSMLGGADVEVLAAREITGVNIGTQATTAKLDRLAADVAAGRMRRPEITTFALAESGQALAEIARRHVRGKLVITP
jgi:NADPH:quinone reductase-like Zn-dependent oxidoreductase